MGFSRRTFLSGSGALFAALAFTGCDPSLGLLPPDANGLRLPRVEPGLEPYGFTSRIIAVAGQEVANTGYDYGYQPDGAATRPLVFAFNGGPGSSSVWLHLGLMGPRRVLLDDNGMPFPPPGRLVDNEHSILDVADLVFIDPVGTGFPEPFPARRPRITTTSRRTSKRSASSSGCI